MSCSHTSTETGVATPSRNNSEVLHRVTFQQSLNLVMGLYHFLGANISRRPQSGGHLYYRRACRGAVTARTHATENVVPRS